MDIRDIMQHGNGMQGMAQPGTPPPGNSPISALMKAGGGDGLKRIAATVVAISRKALEMALPVYGADSEEGRDILTAIGKLSKITKGIQTGDMHSVMQSMNALNPAQNGDLLSKLQGLLNKGGAVPGNIPNGQPGAPPPAPGMPPH